MRSDSLRVCLALAAAVLLATTGAAQADHYAVLVAGSHTYGNYRHHADVCHAYHVLLDHGFSAKNIIVMMYDDVANDPENPFPGQLFNKPTKRGDAGVDVYHGCRKDYTGKTVTAANFINVITGNAAAMKNVGSGRVLESTSNDRVFINFVDHGGVGLIAFPNQPYLYADDLQKALQKMHDNKMYKELVFYMEACESGSMFKGFNTPNIYATTAANAKESSWGTYCAPDDMVNGKSINSCLGDLYSVNWMQDADEHDMSTETLQKQYEIVKRLTNKSHVQQFGDLKTIPQEPADDFIGDSSHSPSQLRLGHLTVSVTDVTNTPARRSSDVDSRDNEVVRLMHKYLRSGDATDAAALMAEVKDRETHKARFTAIATQVLGYGRGIEVMQDDFYTEPESFDCHRAVNAAYDKFCGGHSDFSLKFARVVVNMCELLDGDDAQILKSMESVCAQE